MERENQKNKIVNPKWVVKKLVLLTFCTVSQLFFMACSSGKDEPKTPSAPRQGGNAPSVDVVIVEAEELDYKINTTGTLMANEDVVVKSEVSGRIIQLYFEEGQNVKKGQLLVKLNDNDLKAQLRKLHVQEELARLDENRQKQLLAVKATTQENYDLVLNRLNTVLADIQVLQAEIDKTSIFAPFSGKVGLRYVSVGSFVAPSDVITSIQETDPIKLDFAVPEKYMSFLKNGLEVRFRIAGSDELFIATTYATEPNVDTETRTIQVRAKCRNTKGLLYPGGYAAIEITLKKIDQALLVPAQAIVPELNGQKVFVYKNGIVKESSVEIGLRLEQLVQIAKGIEQGDTLITTGLLQIKDGAEVKVRTVKSIDEQSR